MWKQRYRDNTRQEIENLTIQHTPTANKISKYIVSSSREKKNSEKKNISKAPEIKIFKNILY